MSELKPCPFCGGKAKVVESSPVYLAYRVRCRRCGVETGMYTTAVQAVRCWNDREERTCTMEYQTGADNPKRGWFECSECGGLSDSVGAGWNGEKKRMNPPTYCARCGAKVVG